MNDPNKELEALQAHIEAQEDWFARELDSAKRLIGDVPTAAKPTSAAAGVPARNYPAGTRPIPAPIPELTDEPASQEAPVKKKGIRGLVILALLELLGILGLAGYWLLFLL
jgi:hypothetical protein